MNKRNIVRRFLYGTLLGVLLALFSVAGNVNAAATSYQNPCAPWGVTGYNFGQYVSGWGYHSGQDVCSSAGTPVYAMAEGTVAYSAKTPDSYRWGNLIMIEHTNPDGSKAVSLYGHLANDRRVAAGQVIGKGQLIGFVGPAWTAENGNWAAHTHVGVHLGAYGAPAGTYASYIVGYTSTTAALGGWANATDYINGHVNSTPPPPPANHWDYAVTGVTGTGSYGQNQPFDMDIKVKNTGNTTWTVGGNYPTRLGTIVPNNRGSGFSAGMGGQGWLTPNRIQMQADTPPGGIATFHAKMNPALIAPGYYVERFAPIVDGIGWMADRDIWIGITVKPHQYAAQLMGEQYYRTSSPTDVSQPFTAQYLSPQTKVNAKAYIKNVGDIAWTSTGPNPVHLGTTRPNDRGSGFLVTGDGSIPASENWMAYNRPSAIDGRLESNGQITPTDTVNPGETAVFSFTIKGIPTPGSFPEYFNPVVEGKGWMNDVGAGYLFRVLPTGYHYEYVGQTDPAALALSRSEQTAVVDVRNSGQSNWQVGGNVRLGTDRARDRASDFKGSDWIAANRPSTVDSNLTQAGKNTISPGEIGRFSFRVANPTKPDGSYPEYVHPVVDGAGWMPEDYGIAVPVKVQSPNYDYQVISQKFDQDIFHLHAGQTMTASLVIRNLGNRPWPVAGPNPVVLATSRPNDRGSGFAQLTGSDPWSSNNRPSKIDGKVTSVNPLVSEQTTEIGQGDLALVTFPIRVPALNPGVYPEYFNLVQEGVTWLPDYGIYFPLTVSP